MSSNKRKNASGTTNYNFRPQTESSKWEAKGTKPLPKPVSVMETILTILIHCCRKILFVNTNIKVGLYAAGLFLSFLGDVYPFPKTYFARSDNMFNQYFVKIGWGWTLSLTVPFVVLTSFTTCCGKRNLVLHHLARIGIATASWFIFTSSFVYIEQNFGRCSMKGERYSRKQACLSAGHFWHSLDISGHSFILIYSTLVIIEEARAIIGWETIKDMIRNEEHSRCIGETNLSSPLKQLTNEEFLVMKASYTKFTPYVRGLFIALTVLSLIWDLMIVSTMLYFHIMIEKLISGLLAISVWFLTYKVWYTYLKPPPCLPGDGLFKYNKNTKGTRDVPLRSRGSFSSNSSSRSGKMPTFMGMPLYGLKTPTETNIQPPEELDNSISDTDVPLKPSAGGYSTRFRNQSMPQWTTPPTRMTTRSTARNNGNVTI